MSESDLARWFESTFGRPFPAGLPVPAQRPHPQQTFWTSDISEALTPATLMTPAFPGEPEAYVVAGHWGHGMNAFAFYFIRKEPGRKHFFRLAIGGAYGNFAEDADAIHRFLEAYARWDLVERPARVEDETLVFSMGQGEARWTRTGTLTGQAEPLVYTGKRAGEAPEEDAVEAYWQGVRRVFTAS